MALWKGTLAVLFADICDSVRLYEAIGDEAAQRLVAARLGELGVFTRQFDGRTIGTRGDGLLAAFPDADAAFDAARAMLAGDTDGGLAIKIGGSLGPVIDDGAEVYGDTANIAARVTGLARPGEILITREFVDALRPDLRATVAAIGEIVVKGRTRKVEVFRALLDAATDELTVAMSTPQLQPMLRLLLIAGAQRALLPAVGGSLILGREPGCDVVLNSPLVSRRHALIRSGDGCFQLVDQSTNGTFVVTFDGQRIFVRRDTLTLPRAGLLSLGDPPENADGARVEFLCTAAN